MRKGMLLAGVALIGVAVAVLVVGLQSNKTIPYDVHEVPLASDNDEGEDSGSSSEAYEPDWSSLSGSVVAWVRIPGTTVDYPVMQGEEQDPDFYLTHDSNGNYSAWGTPYIDAGCAQGTDSALVVVYGHHMSDGTMFAPLAQYSDASFAKQHEAIYVYTRETIHKLKVFAVDVVNADIESKPTDVDGVKQLKRYLSEKLKDCEVVFEKPKGISQVWAFVTCSYQTDNSRTIVYAADTSKE